MGHSNLIQSRRRVQRWQRVLRDADHRGDMVTAVKVEYLLSGALKAERRAQREVAPDA